MDMFKYYLKNLLSATIFVSLVFIIGFVYVAELDIIFSIFGVLYGTILLFVLAVIVLSVLFSVFGKSE